MKSSLQLGVTVVMQCTPIDQGKPGAHANSPYNIQEWHSSGNEFGIWIGRKQRPADEEEGPCQRVHQLAAQILGTGEGVALVRVETRVSCPCLPNSCLSSAPIL